MQKETPVLNRFIAATALAMTLVLPTAAQAQATADALVRQISVDVIEAAKNDKAIQAGDIGRVIALVDAKVMPNVNFEVMTDRKSTRLNSSHPVSSRMPSSA